MRGGEGSAGPNRALITASIMLATIMQGVDNTIANVALPHMQGSLSAAQDQIAWVLTSYIVSAAIMTPLTGWLAGRFGIKYVFLVSVVGFTAALRVCAAAPTSLAQLVIYRLLQGVCGAALVPLSQSVLLQINPPERHGQAMAMWGMGVMLGPIIGPALGRLADRRLQLALGVLHQHAGRHCRRARHPVLYPVQPAEPSRAVRLFRLSDIELRRSAHCS